MMTGSTWKAKVNSIPSPPSTPPKTKSMPSPEESMIACTPRVTNARACCPAGQ